MAETQSEQIETHRRQVAEAKTDKEKIDALYSLATDLIFIDSNESARLAEESLALSRKIGYSLGEGYSNYVLVAREYALGNFAEAEQRAKNTLSEARRLDHKDLQMRILSVLGGIYGAIGNLENACETGLESLRLAETLGNPNGIVAALNNLSVNSRESIDYTKSLEYLNRSVKISTENNLTHLLGYTYREFGSVYAEMEDYPKAVEYLNRSLACEKDNKNWLRASDALNNLAIVYSRSGDQDKAEACHLEALSYREKFGDQHSVAASLIGLGSLYLRRKEYDSAISYYTKAMEIAVSTGSRKQQMHLQIGLSQAYEGKKNYKKALKLAKLSFELGEELQKGAFEERERRFKAQFETDKARRETEIERLKNVELEKAQRLARVGSYIWDANSDKFSGSIEFYRLLNRQPEDSECTLERFLSKIKTEDRGQVRKAFLSALEWRSMVDVVARAEDLIKGHHRTFHIIGEWVEGGGDGKKLSGTLQDITLQLEADEARREREKLEGMLEMAGAFSHEINQPMQVIVTATELLMYRFPNNEEVHKSVEKILKAATRMSEITGRLTKTTTYKTKQYVGETRIVDAGEGK